ncbi:MAG TPA: hypothetical protein VFZ09_16345 [Archangium sp.]|uniref:hypothetical protein n=1 Tax=Archangium sp. TaxID=1872627 RepID=UPI002E34958B|nr:hypothetical protein [Archangium sp.]HEX5747816.1 hypothetical protein [Archangium sp.]
MAQEIGRRMSENEAPVSPAPDVSHLSTAELVAALRALPYRQTAFLLTRLVQDRSTRESALFYGITLEAFCVHLLRAGLALTRAAVLPCREPENEAEEDVWSRALAEALEREAAAVPGALTETVALCRRLRALGREVAAALEAAEREQEESPKGRREDVLRRLAVAVLLVLTAFLYCNRPEEAPERRVQPRSLERRGPGRRGRWGIREGDAHREPCPAHAGPGGLSQAGGHPGSRLGR